MLTEIARSVNTLGDFCGMRDLDRLSRECLRGKYSIERADVAVLFGASILCGSDVLAHAVHEDIARNYVIVGGEGHTTPTLRAKVHSLYPEIVTEGKPEAQVFAAYIKRRYGLDVSLLECSSTNCGNNITLLLDLLRSKSLPHQSFILIQDATMQRRMDAGLRKYASPGTTIINYASYSAEVIAAADRLVFRDAIPGMWDMEHYIGLLLGEIPRLNDTEEGYGPNGKGFISHVDVPAEVLSAYSALQKKYSACVRQADPRYASK